MKYRSVVLRSVLVFGLLLFSLLYMGSCNPANAASAKKIVVGQTKQLKTKGTSRWKSSRPSVARVSKSGLVTAVRQGTCKITAVKNGRKVSWKFKVYAPKLSATRKTLDKKKSFTLTLKGAGDLKFSWVSSDKSVLKLKKKKKNKYLVTAAGSGTAVVYVARDTYQVACVVKVNDPEAQEKNNQKKEPEQKEEESDPKIQTLYMDGNVFKQMTWNRSDTGVYISNVSRFGQSAPLYIHKDGGDGLENIWAATNNGAVGLPGVSLSAEAVSGTILKACFWARAVSDSDFHGYDFGHSYNGANIMYTFGQAKPNGLGTGDYCCSTIPLCAYYFAGVNVIGENLGGADAKYIPNSTLLFYHGRDGEISFYENGELTSAPYLSNYEWRIFRACGFKDVVDSYNSDRDSFQFLPGDVVTANGHTQMVIGKGTKKDAETVQAYGHDKVKKGAMPKGGDQGYEIGRAYGVRTSPTIKHIMRFTGEGVRLNTVGLIP